MQIITQIFQQATCRSLTLTCRSYGFPVRCVGGRTSEIPGHAFSRVPITPILPFAPDPRACRLGSQSDLWVPRTGSSVFNSVCIEPIANRSVRQDCRQGPNSATMRSRSTSSTTSDSAASSAFTSAQPETLAQVSVHTRGPSRLAPGGRQRHCAQYSQPRSANPSPDRGRSVVPAAPIRRWRSFCILRPRHIEIS